MEPRLTYTSISIVCFDSAHPTYCVTICLHTDAAQIWVVAAGSLTLQRDVTDEGLFFTPCGCHFSSALVAIVRSEAWQSNKQEIKWENQYFIEFREIFKMITRTSEVWMWDSILLKEGRIVVILGLTGLTGQLYFGCLGCSLALTQARLIALLTNCNCWLDPAINWSVNTGNNCPGSGPGTGNISPNTSKSLTTRSK